MKTRTIKTFENIELQPMSGPQQGNAKWYSVVIDGVKIGEISEVMHSLNRVNGWTFKSESDKLNQMHRIYNDGKKALHALCKANNYE
jgi:hypothetical protein